MNVLTFERLVVAGDDPDPLGGAPADCVVPVIDGARLCDLLPGDPHPGVWFVDVAPPSRHWLGEPLEIIDGGAVVLDGTCGIAECCGVVARIEIDADHVRWRDLLARGGERIPRRTTFTFDRRQYEEAVHGIGALAPMPWEPWDEPETDD